MHSACIIIKMSPWSGSLQMSAVVGNEFVDRLAKGGLGHVAVDDVGRTRTHSGSGHLKAACTNVLE